MLFHEIVKLGEKMDIKVDEITARTKLEDIIDPQRFVISHPTYKLVPIELREKAPVQFMFFRPNGLYIFSAVLEKRFVRDHCMFCIFRVISEVEKRQRRLGYRLSTVLDVTLYVRGEDTEKQQKLMAKVLNIAERGVLLSCFNPLPVGKKISARIQLGGKDLVIFCAEVLRCEPPDKKNDPYLIALQFKSSSIWDQTYIRKYIFKQQIMQRKREKEE